MAMCGFSMDETLDSLLGEDVAYWLLDRLRKMRSKTGHGVLEMRIQDGHVFTYSEKTIYKVSGRERIRTRANNRV